MLLILERVEQPDEPRGLDSRQDISLHQDMLDFIHLCQSSLAHLFQSADFIGIGFASEIDGPVATLTDLSDDSELLDSELGSALSQDYAFTAAV